MPNGGKGDIQAVEMDGVIYIPGGYGGKFSDQLVAYDASANSWSTLAPMQALRALRMALTLLPRTRTRTRTPGPGPEP